MRRVKGWLRALVVGFLTIAGTHLDDPVLGQAIGFQPIPAAFPSGAMLDVTPAVSADRRYVRMGIGVSFSIAARRQPSLDQSGGPHPGRNTC